MTFTVQEFRDIQIKTDKLYKTIYGNGEIGMDEHIRNITAWIDTQKAVAERRRVWWDKFQWVVIPAALGLLLTLLGQAVYFYVQIVPQINNLITVHK